MSLGMQLRRRLLPTCAPEGTLRRRALQLAKKAARSCRQRGLLGTARQAVARLRPPRPLTEAQRLEAWIRENSPTPAQLEEQRRWSRSLTSPARVSLLLNWDGSSKRRLCDTLTSLREQTYSHWQIVLVGPEAKIAGLDSLSRDAVWQGRLHIVPTPTDAVAHAQHKLALACAEGDFVAVLDAGDRLSPHALYSIAQALEQAPDCDVLYTDEDRLVRQQRQDLQLKPDWSPELMLSYNYVGRLAVMRRASVLAAGGFNPHAARAQEWDLLLRLAERGARLRRVPLCVYHRFGESDGRRASGQDPQVAAEHRQVLAAHLRRQGVEPTVSSLPDGTHRATWPLARQPLVSIIIPSRNHPELIQRCVQGLLRDTAYRWKEILIVDNNSTDPEVLEHYRQWESEGTVRVVPFNREFNYSAACNAGARQANGELLLFLNNDIEVQHADWLEELVRWATRPGVGMVGTRLVYPNRVLQHAGVVIGMHMCGLIYNRLEGERWGVFGSPDTYRNYLAIMGACQMTPRKLFEELGGFDERYRIANSDVALCLRAWKAGYRCVYTPFAELIHYEGYTRGKTNPPEDIEMTALDFRELRFEEDPCFHPALSSAFSTPQLRLAPEPSPREALAQQITSLLSIYKPPTTIDLFNDQQMAELAGTTGAPFPRPQEDRQSTLDAKSAVAWILARLCASEELRRRFPQALSHGVEGEFCRWLCGDGASPRLSAAEVQAVQDAFRRKPGARARQVWQLRDDLRREFPLGLTPAGRRELLQWLLEFGRGEYGLCNEGIWWFVLECQEDPLRELAHAFLHQPHWQQLFADALTEFGQPRFLEYIRNRYVGQADWLAAGQLPCTMTPLEQVRLAYSCRADWRAHAPLAFVDGEETRSLVEWLRHQPNAPSASFWESLEDEMRDAPTQTCGLNLLGHFRYPSGLQGSAKAVIEGLRANGVPCTSRDVPTGLASDEPHRDAYLGQELYDASLIHVQPEPFFETAYERAALPAGKQVFRIGYWYWEFETAPPEWARAAAMVDELWAPTSFIGRALESLRPGAVHNLMPGVRLAPFKPLPRSRFGLPEDEFLFLFMFDMNSITERKNPLGLISAFQQAFRPDDRATLVIKTARGHNHPLEMQKLRAAAAGAKVKLIDEVMTREESYALMQACDSYVSLHRSEGFGLTMAETMLMSKPVIATAYSGNMDFMSPANSLLVDYKLVTLEQDIPPYKAGLSWAEPSAADAARKMRWVHDHPHEARLLGQRARADAEQTLSIEAAGRRMARRLAEITELIKARRLLSVTSKAGGSSKPADACRVIGPRKVQSPHMLARLLDQAAESSETLPTSSR